MEVITKDRIAFILSNVFYYKEIVRSVMLLYSSILKNDLRSVIFFPLPPLIT